MTGKHANRTKRAVKGTLSVTSCDLGMDLRGIGNSNGMNGVTALEWVTVRERERERKDMVKRRRKK